MTKKEKKTERVIYSNMFGWITDEELEQSLIDSGIEEEDITEEDLNNERAFIEEQYFEDDCENLNFETDGRIIAIADLGLWNGRVSGYKICDNNLNEILKVGNHDYIRAYQDKDDIRKISVHHDGTNHLLFREIREDRDIDNLLNAIYNGEEISRQKLAYYTKSLNHYVDDIFGRYF